MLISIYIKLNFDSVSGLVVRLTFTEKILILIQILSMTNSARNTQILASVVPVSSVYLFVGFFILALFLTVLNFN